MGFITVKNVKLGNMRKAQNWTVTPSADIKEGIVTMQCDNRIARVNLNDGTARLSSGKGGHQGFAQLSPTLGAFMVVVAPEVITQIKAAVEGRDDYSSGGPIRVM